MDLGLLLGLGLLVCSLILGIGTFITEARAKKATVGPGRCTAFQKLNFGIHDVLEYIKEENFFGKGGAGVVYRDTMPNGEQVAVSTHGDWLFK